MNTRGRHHGLPRPLSLIVLALALGAAGCPKKEEPVASDDVAEAEAEAKSPPEVASAVPDDQASNGAMPVLDEALDDSRSDESHEAAETGQNLAAGELAQVDEEAEPQPDTKAILKTVVNRRTKDDDAKTLLAQAEEAGATLREVAKAAVDRGLQLHATPDRAAVFFEWAAEKDPKFPDPVWHLARQAVTEGDVVRAKELLAQVKERGGKRLLSQIDFDPMWEIVKDDPEVRKLL